MDIFFNQAYANLYKDIEGQCTTFHFQCKYGEIIHIFILRKIKWSIDNNYYYDIVTPYGYGGPLILACQDIQKLMNEYYVAFSDYCNKNNIICEFIRFHLFDNVDVRKYYYGETKATLENVIVNTTGSYEDIWKNYNHKIRKNVNKALKQGLTVVYEENDKHLDAFLDIYYTTMKRNNASQFYYFKKEYFEQIVHSLFGSFVFFYIFYENKIISTELVLFSKNYAYSFLGGTNENYYDYRPNDLLKNEIIKWCNLKNIQKFILGGGHQSGDGIYIYKRFFANEPDVMFYTGKYIFNKSKYTYFVEKRKEENSEFDLNSNYFPLYRA